LTPTSPNSPNTLIRQIKTIKDVVDWDLCIGCGACFFACQKGSVTLVNIESEGIRPRFEGECGSCTACLNICPGNRVDAPLPQASARKTDDGQDEFGPALEIWEGFAGDPEIRFSASSGGLITAIALYCLEREGMGSVLHTAMDESKPWTNRTVQSHDRSELLARSGSRYAPSSPCEGLRGVKESPKPCVVIGKPCDASAVAMLSSVSPELDRKIGLNLTFFCAGTPSTRGTLDLINLLGTAPDQISSVRYRGRGWPGRFSVSSKNGTDEKSLSYQDSWGRLSKYRPWRCHLCPDGLGSSADISCGDAWERFGDASDIGRSIVIVRTERGRAILRRAIKARYVELEPVGPQVVIAAQENLLRRRKELFGRLLAMKLLLVPTPSFTGFSLFQAWVKLPFSRRLRTVAGTLKRVLTRGLWKRRSVS
jgi:coenzyme F420 hydrogenase subunit beta